MYTKRKIKKLFLSYRKVKRKVRISGLFAFTKICLFCPGRRGQWGRGRKRGGVKGVEGGYRKRRGVEKVLKEEGVYSDLKRGEASPRNLTMFSIKIFIDLFLNT